MLLELIQHRIESVCYLSYLVITNAHGAQKVWQLDNVFGHGRLLVRHANFHESPEVTKDIHSYNLVFKREQGGIRVSGGLTGDPFW